MKQKMKSGTFFVSVLPVCLIVALVFAVSSCRKSSDIPGADLPEISEPSPEGSDAPLESSDIPPENSDTPSEPEQYRYEISARLHEEMPEYRFVATGEDRFVMSLRVYDEKDAPVLSVDFEPEAYAVYPEMMDTMGLHVTDTNFDGYKDVIILNTFYGAHANTWYDCWLWDVSSSTFVSSKSFAGICNPAIDRDNKCVYSSGGSGAGTWYSAIYKFIGGEFVLSNSLLLQWEHDVANEVSPDDPPIIVVRIWEEQLVNGKMETVRDISVPEEQADGEVDYYRTDGFWQLDHPRWYMVGGHEADKWLEG